MCTPPRFLIPITDDLQPRAYLPSYEEVLLQDEYEYSSRLPTYQFRSLRRYHPYLRFILPSSLEGPSFARYYHTIYDEEYIHLDVPPLRTTPAVIVPPAAPTPIAAALGPVAQANAQAAAPHLEVDEARIQRLGDLIFEFVAGVRRAIEGHTAEVHNGTPTENTNGGPPAPPI